jgi:hypothetical protein
MPCALGVGTDGEGDLLTDRESVQCVRIGLRGRDTDWNGGLGRLTVDVLCEESQEFGAALLLECFASEYGSAILEDKRAGPCGSIGPDRRDGCLSEGVAGVDRGS